MGLKANRPKKMQAQSTAQAGLNSYRDQEMPPPPWET